MAFDYWVQKKLIKSGKSTKNAVFNPNELCGQLLGDSTFYLLRVFTVAQWIGLISSEVTRLVATEHVRKKCSLLRSSSMLIVIYTAKLLTLSFAI